MEQRRAQRHSLLRRAKRKLRARRGVSLVEMMCALLIMGMTAALVTQGISLATQRMREQNARADAQTLCVTLSTVVQEELTYAADVSVDEDSKVTTFFSSAIGAGTDSRFVLRAGDACSPVTSEETDARGRICLAARPTADGYDAAVPLAADGVYAAGEGLTAGMTLSYEDGRFAVDLTVYGKDGAALARSVFTVTPAVPNKG